MRVLFIAGLLIACSTAPASPKSDYMIHCMGCHLSDGSGMPPDVPHFNEQLLTMAATEKGRAYLVQVPGASQSPLSDKELAALINWLLNEYTSGGFSRFTTEEVNEHRKITLLNPATIRAEIVGR